jgi:putative ABC transport system ATP-binding protein
MVQTTLTRTTKSPHDEARPLVRLHGVVKTCDTPAGAFVALRNVSLQVAPGEFVAITGRSGSGKSSLIKMLTGIDWPTSGEVMVGDVTLHSLSENQLAIWRGSNLVIIFQFFQLLPTLSVLDNVIPPIDFVGRYAARERQQRAMALLDQVGLAEHAHKLPSELSGGQQQRAAIARALSNDPPQLVYIEATRDLLQRLWTSRWLAAGVAASIGAVTGLIVAVLMPRGPITAGDALLLITAF